MRRILDFVIYIAVGVSLVYFTILSAERGVDSHTFSVLLGSLVSGICSFGMLFELERRGTTGRFWALIAALVVIHAGITGVIYFVKGWRSLWWGGVPALEVSVVTYYVRRLPR